MQFSAAYLHEVDAVYRSTLSSHHHVHSVTITLHVLHIPVAGNGNKQLVPDIPYSSVWYVMISFEQAIILAAPKQQF